MNPCIRFHKCADVLPVFSTAVPPDVRKVSDFVLPTFRLMGLRPAPRAQPAAGLSLLAEGLSLSAHLMAKPQAVET